MLFVNLDQFCVEFNSLHFISNFVKLNKFYLDKILQRILFDMNAIESTEQMC